LHRFDSQALFFLQVSDIRLPQRLISILQTTIAFPACSDVKPFGIIPQKKVNSPDLSV
jgi:hypothetical protein